MTYILLFLTGLISIICFTDRKLVGKLSLSPYKVVNNREWYRVITHMFVHGDYMHLFVNLLVLWSFGLQVEKIFDGYQRVGTVANASVTFLLLYFLGGIAASAFDIYKYRKSPNYSSIGASGAVSAVIFTSIFFAPWQNLYLFGIVPIPGILFGVLYLFYSQHMGKRSVGNINHYAHFYGAIFGFIFPLFIDINFFALFLKNIKL